MDLLEIGGLCKVNQLLGFGWLPNNTLHLRREDNINLVSPDEFNQALKIGTLFLRVFRCTDVVLFKDDDDLDAQAMILRIALGFFKTFGDLHGGVRA